MRTWQDTLHSARCLLPPKPGFPHRLIISPVYHNLCSSSAGAADASTGQPLAYVGPPAFERRLHPRVSSPTAPCDPSARAQAAAARCRRRRRHRPLAACVPLVGACVPTRATHELSCIPHITNQLKFTDSIVKSYFFVF